MTRKPKLNQDKECMEPSIPQILTEVLVSIFLKVGSRSMPLIKTLISRTTIIEIFSINQERLLIMIKIFRGMATYSQLINMIIITQTAQLETVSDTPQLVKVSNSRTTSLPTATIKFTNGRTKRGSEVTSTPNTRKIEIFCIKKGQDQLKEPGPKLGEVHLINCQGTLISSKVQVLL